MITSNTKLMTKVKRDKENRFLLIIRDNGIGFPKDIDFLQTRSLGLQLVIALTRQLDGIVELDKSEGTTFRITFP